MAEPILIWGAGAIGGTVGACWARAGIDTMLVDVVPEHVHACRTTGLHVEGPVEDFSVVVPAATPGELSGRFTRVILAVKAHHTAEAVSALAPYLSADGFVMSAQNGLNEIEIARHVGRDRTMGALINFGADWLGPGRVFRGNRGAVVVGEIHGPPRKRTHEMHDLLRMFDPAATLTDDIWGFLWGKLAYGAMLFASALNMDSIAENFADPARFPVWLAIGREVTSVATARNVTPVGFDGFDPTAFGQSSGEDKARRTIAELAAFNRGSAKTHSGVWRDLAIRKRRTEVDAQIGVVVKLGAEVGIRTPAIDRLVELVHDVEEGRRPQSAATFDELMSACN